MRIQFWGRINEQLPLTPLRQRYRRLMRHLKTFAEIVRIIHTYSELLFFFSKMPSKSEKLPTVNAQSINIYSQLHVTFYSNFKKLTPFCRKVADKVGKVTDHLVGGWCLSTAPLANPGACPARAPPNGTQFFHFHVFAEKHSCWMFVPLPHNGVAPPSNLKFWICP